MKRPISNVMRILANLICFIGLAVQGYAQHSVTTMSHEMQHGFVLAANDIFASHLVATGHHSRQTEITGNLVIDDRAEMAFYEERKSHSSGSSYFLFQAQSLDLPSLTDGQILTGHIVESKIGAYEPKNIIVKRATFHVHKVLLNILNPFFSGESQYKFSKGPKRLLRQDDSYSDNLLNNTDLEKKHCCDIPGKRCNWKC